MNANLAIDKSLLYSIEAANFNVYRGKLSRNVPWDAMVHIPGGFATLLVGMQDRLPRLERLSPRSNIPTGNAI